MRASETGYDGIPYGDLSFERIDWSHRGEYIRTRSLRNGGDEFDVEPEWATEAVLDDPDAVAVPNAGKSERCHGDCARLLAGCRPDSCGDAAG